jgi:UDP-N-acetylmuramoyl-tripeptide--D-alanyl-D-alanine ligase
MDNEHRLSWTTSEILEATGGELLCGGEDHRFIGISIDSRTIAPNDMFVAIIGNVHDGHTFIHDVLNQGVKGLIVNSNKMHDFPVSELQTRNIACVTVNDTTRALGNLAAFHRSRLDISVVAITGSNGKTTTRKMTTDVVSCKFKTLSTIGNYNNEIGVPLTLLQLSPEHEWAVVELGTNSHGEIARLTKICMPDIGVITNIGPAHLEGLGSLEGVMQEKGQLINYLKPNGKAVLNADDHRVSKIAAETKKDVLLFGLSRDAEIRASAIKAKTSGVCFNLDLPPKSMVVNLSMPGQFMVTNALAAASVGYLLDLPTQEIKRGLEGFKPAWGRMNILKTPNGISIIDDTYNANPDSMKAAITTLKSLRANNRSVLVAGDMLELGEQSESLHRQVGALAATSGIKKLYLTGKFTSATAIGAQDAQMKSENIFAGTQQEIIDALICWLKPGDWVLVKGSRGAKMENIVAGLKLWTGLESG